LHLHRSRLRRRSYNLPAGQSESILSGAPFFIDQSYICPIGADGVHLPLTWWTLVQPFMKKSTGTAAADWRQKPSGSKTGAPYQRS
jgi:hypothetical protein